MADEQDTTDNDAPDSLLPYETWTEEAFRGVAVRALDHAARHGLPGEHHFYITFRTDHPDTVVPPRLRARYPDEMTVVLQHKFWDLRVDQAAGAMSVGLSFGGAASTLSIPFDAMTGFADPSVKWGLRFRPKLPDTGIRLVPVPTTADPHPADGAGDVAAGEKRDGNAAEPAPSDTDVPDEVPQVVSLDAFRRRRD